jgi:hypothetical protein
VTEPTIEERLRRVEDQLAIYQVISKYGPAVDSGRFQDAADIWAADGVYEIPGVGSFTGPEGILALLDADLHQQLIHGGSAHVLSLPYVAITGDTAVATNYGRVYVPSADGFGVFRAIATRWEFVRTEDGWRCLRRVNELLDGRQQARDLLAQGL